MNYTLSPISSDDRKSIIDILNYYVENGFAAYPEKPLPYEFFDFMMKAAEGYPTVAAKNESGETVAFGVLRPYHPFSTFAATAEISYFIMHEHTGRGLGGRMLGYLEEGAQRKGIVNILASVSSLNEGSIRFHRTHGFEECGRFKGVVKKKNTLLDTVWLQKKLQPSA